MVYMCFEFHPYILFVQMFRKTYLVILYQMFEFCFIKTYFRAYCQKYRYFILYVYWFISIHTKLQKCLKYLVFVFEVVLKKSFFKLKIDFEKYGFLFKAKFLYYKNSSKYL